MEDLQDQNKNISKICDRYTNFVFELELSYYIQIVTIIFMKR